MKDFFRTSSFELSEVIGSWYDRETRSLRLEHSDDDDNKREDDEEDMDDVHIKQRKINNNK